MPIFEYRCEKCGNVFDQFFRSLEEESRYVMACPQCGSDRMRKLVSVFGLGGNVGGAGSCSSSSDSFKSG
jgi:putative FmdB family regulatory protein